MPNDRSLDRNGPLAIALVGCGRLAERGYLPAIATSSAVELTAVADPSAERRRHLAAASGARAFNSLDALVESASVDAVVIASTAGTHVELAAVAAGAGLPCLVEKPPADDVVSAERMAALAPAPWVGFNRRFHQGIAIGPGIPAEGPFELDLELTYRRTSWRAYEERADALADLGSHLIDLALLLAGETDGRVTTSRIGDRSAELELELSRAHARIRCATDRAYRERVTARDGRGRAIAASVIGGPLWAVGQRLRRDEPPLVSTLRRQVEAFARAVSGADPGLLATASDGVAVMRLVEAARARAIGRRGGRSAPAPAVATGP